MKQKKALILYGTMTKNTEKIALWFKETFEEYNWDVTLFRLSNGADYRGMQKSLYFDDYDVVCLGSPIVAGAPIQPVIKALSLGGGGALEKEVQDKLDSSKNEDAAAAPAKPGASWRRAQAPYAGTMNRGESIPLGIVFSTYGGGFYGSGEAMATLETLKLYLTINNVNVVGKFCCAGRETGPAGFPTGVKPPAFFIPGKKGKDVPPADVADAVSYEMKDGTRRPGSYFFHYDLDEKPGDREESKAKAFISDFVEDFFMTYDGVPNPAISEILSIS